MKQGMLALLLSAAIPSGAGPPATTAAAPTAPFADAALYQSAPARTSQLAAPDVAPRKITLPPTAPVPQQPSTGSDTDAIRIGYV